MMTNELHGEVKASSLKVKYVRPCSHKRGYSCFPAAIRFCILLVLWIYSKGNGKKTISKETKIFLPIGKGVSNDDKFLAKWVISSHKRLQSFKNYFFVPQSFNVKLHVLLMVSADLTLGRKWHKEWWQGKELSGVRCCNITPSQDSSKSILNCTAHWQKWEASV